MDESECYGVSEGNGSLLIEMSAGLVVRPGRVRSEAEVKHELVSPLPPACLLWLLLRRSRNWETLLWLTPALESLLMAGRGRSRRSQPHPGVLQVWRLLGRRTDFDSLGGEAREVGLQGLEDRVGVLVGTLGGGCVGEVCQLRVLVGMLWQTSSSS